MVHIKPNNVIRKRYCIVPSPRMTITSSNDFQHLTTTYTTEQTALIIYRNFLRLSKYYSHIPKIQLTFKEYVKYRFQDDYGSRLRRAGVGMSPDGCAGNLDEMMLSRLFNSLIFVNNACCSNGNGNGDTEYKILKLLLSLFHKEKSDKAQRVQLWKMRDDSLLMFDRCLISMNETLKLLL